MIFAFSLRDEGGRTSFFLHSPGIMEAKKEKATPESALGWTGENEKITRQKSRVPVELALTAIGVIESRGKKVRFYDFAYSPGTIAIPLRTYTYTDARVCGWREAIGDEREDTLRKRNDSAAAARRTVTDRTVNRSSLRRVFKKRFHGTSRNHRYHPPSPPPPPVKDCRRDVLPAGWMG